MVQSTYKGSKERKKGFSKAERKAIRAAWVDLADPESPNNITKYGICLFPIKPGKKTPACKWTQEFTNTRTRGTALNPSKVIGYKHSWVTDLEDLPLAGISENTSYNIGVKLPSNLVLMDLDTYKGIKFLEIATERCWDLTTIGWRTGRGGIQLLFRYPGEERLVPNSKVCDGTVDIKTGSVSNSGGYGIAPGSVNKSVEDGDGRYKWLEGQSPSECELKDMPADMLEWLLAQPSQHPTKKKTVSVPSTETVSSLVPRSSTNISTKKMNLRATKLNEILQTQTTKGDRWKRTGDLILSLSSQGWSDQEMLDLISCSPKGQEMGAGWILSQLERQRKQHAKFKKNTLKTKATLNEMERAAVSKLNEKVFYNKSLKQIPGVHAEIQVTIAALTAKALELGKIEFDLDYRTLKSLTGIQKSVRYFTTLSKIIEGYGWATIINRGERDPNRKGGRATSKWQLNISAGKITSPTYTYISGMPSANYTRPNLLAVACSVSSHRPTGYSMCESSKHTLNLTDTKALPDATAPPPDIPKEDIEILKARLELLRSSKLSPFYS